MTNRSIEVDDSHYISSHLRQPRGRGGWIFSFGHPDEMKNWRSYYGTFTAARKAARADAIDAGVSTIFVMP